MKERLAIESAIAKQSGVAASITSVTACSGGSINQANIIELRAGRQFFVKQNPASNLYPGMYAAEYKSLQMLGKVGAIPVPITLAVSDRFSYPGR